MKDIVSIRKIRFGSDRWSWGLLVEEPVAPDASTELAAAVEDFLEEGNRLV
jgi:hypothetical protein